MSQTDALLALNASAPVPMLLWCPECGARHIDEGEFETKSHHTHACQSCGHVWRPAIGSTVGVKFLPGFKNSPETASSAPAYCDKYMGVKVNDVPQFCNRESGHDGDCVSSSRQQRPREPAEPACRHETLGLGPRLPLRHGSAETEVCLACGMWRDARNVGEHYRRSGKGFRPAAELLISIARKDDEG